MMVDLHIHYLWLMNY